MIATASVHPDVIEDSARDCYLVYRSGCIWPISAYVPKGPGRGILEPTLEPGQAPSPLTVGVFERSDDVYELAWKNCKGSDLESCIGKNGIRLVQAIAINEVERLRKIYGFKYEVKVTRAGIQISIERESNG
jgi:hypothetical protein